MRRRAIRCTLSGSFHKDRSGLYAAYDELIATGCQVLSPHRMDFDDEDVLFIRDAAEIALSEESIERHHLLAIAQSDFLWLHAPDGYIGVSAALEVGYALARGIPILSNATPAESVFSAFIRTVPSVYRAIESLP